MTTRPTAGRSSVDVARSVAERTKARVNDPREVWGLPYPFPSLNKYTGGIQEGLTVLAGRPGTMKTNFMCHTTDTVASYLESEEGLLEHPGEQVKVVICESTAEVFMRRWACIRAGVSARRVKDGSIGKFPDDYERFMQELRAVARLPVRYLDHPQTLVEVTDFLAEGKTAWWAMDHLHACPYLPGRPNDHSVGILTDISNVLGTVAEQAAPGLALCHTNREVDGREDKHPQRRDLKGSGSLEGRARVVLGIFNPRIYPPPVPPERRREPWIVEVQLLKDNEGDYEMAFTDLLFHPRTGQLEDVTELPESED